MTFTGNDYDCSNEKLFQFYILIDQKFELNKLMTVFSRFLLVLRHFML